MIQLEPIVLAAKEGRIEDIQQLIDAAPDERTRQDLADRALKTSSYWGHTELVTWLVAHDADVNYSTPEGATPLMSAAAKAQVEVVSILLRAGADPNAKEDDGTTALMRLATSEGMTQDESKRYLEVGKLLLDAGADPNLVDRDGCSALIRSLFDQRIDFISLLLQSGGDPNIGPSGAGTAIQIATKRGYQEIVELFRGIHGSEDDLLKAAREGDLSSTTSLLAVGIDPNCRSQAGWTPLLEAALNGIELVDTLLQAGANPNLSTPQGYTPLMRAAGHDRTDVVSLLVRWGANILAKDHRGLTACEMAIAERAWKAAAELALMLAAQLQKDADSKGLEIEYVPLDEPKIIGLISMSLRTVGGVVRWIDLHFEDGQIPIPTRAWGSLVYELPAGLKERNLKSLGIPIDQS